MTDLSAVSLFPVKLHRMLKDASGDNNNNNREDDKAAGVVGNSNGFDDIISWSIDGKSFHVHNKERFATEIMPTYFGSTKFRSFQKNCNMWGFTIERRNGKISHPLFCRDNESSIHLMRRRPIASRQQKNNNKQDSSSLLLMKQAAADRKDEEGGTERATATVAPSSMQAASSSLLSSHLRGDHNIFNNFLKPPVVSPPQSRKMDPVEESLLLRLPYSSPNDSSNASGLAASATTTSAAAVSNRSATAADILAEAANLVSSSWQATANGATTIDLESLLGSSRNAVPTSTSSSSMYAQALPLMAARRTQYLRNLLSSDGRCGSMAGTDSGTGSAFTTAAALSLLNPSSQPSSATTATTATTSFPTATTMSILDTALNLGIHGSGRGGTIANGATTTAPTSTATATSAAAATAAATDAKLIEAAMLLSRHEQQQQQQQQERNDRTTEALILDRINTIRNRITNELSILDTYQQLQLLNGRK